MSRPTLALLAVTTIALGCYKDDVRTLGPASRKPMAKVFLTDDPFPFDSVQSVQVYIIGIDVSTRPDTGTSADSMHWVNVAAPHRQVDLLTLQQGLTDSLGIGEVTADQYKAVRVTINVDSSAGIRFKNGSPAVVRWNGSGQESYAVFVQAPINVPDTGAVIVIDFDVGRSFVYNQLGDGAFDFFAAIRAVNRAATGNIAGIVSHDTSAGPAGPVADATVSAWGGGPNNWFILSTGKTDAAGHYRLAYLLPGTYIVGVAPPAPAASQLRVGTRFERGRQCGRRNHAQCDALSFPRRCVHQWRELDAGESHESTRSDRGERAASAGSECPGGMAEFGHRRAHTRGGQQSLCARHIQDRGNGPGCRLERRVGGHARHSCSPRQHAVSTASGRGYIARRGGA